VGLLERATLGTKITQLLRKQIVRGELPPGKHLAEPLLASEFDVSRAPIREALLQLEAEGLVTSVKNKVYVVGLSDEAIEELYSLRFNLELMAINRIVDRCPEVDWALAESHLHMMALAAEARDPSAFAEADLAFHHFFYSAAKHSRLLAVWELYEKTFAALLDVTNRQDRDLAPAVEVHRQLLNAVRTGDRDLIRRHLKSHMDGSQDRLTLALRNEVRTWAASIS
jgi:GntR family transcriptional regulator of gluconate operon